MISSGEKTDTKREGYSKSSSTNLNRVETSIFFFEKATELAVLHEIIKHIMRLNWLRHGVSRQLFTFAERLLKHAEVNRK